MTVPSGGRCASGGHVRVHVLSTQKGANVFIVPVAKMMFIFRLVASLGKYAFRKRNAYLFIDCSIDYGLTVV